MAVLRVASVAKLLSLMNIQHDNIMLSYNKALEGKVIPDLEIELKQYLENIRSILDYTAHDIEHHYLLGRDIVHFPIVGKSSDLKSFEGAVGRNLPSLKEKSAILYKYLESIQPYHDNYRWLGDLSDVTNIKKHTNLIPQKRMEDSFVTVSSGNGSVSWGSGVTFGSGVSIMGVPIDPYTQMPVHNNSINVKKEIWVDFVFEGSEISILGLLRSTKERIPIIVKDIYNHMQ